MYDYLVEYGWLPWLIGVAIIYPAVVIAIGEISFRIRHKHPLFAEIFRSIQFILLPSFIIMEMMSSVMGIDESNLIFKVFSTIFWISVIFVVVSLFNAIMLGGEKTSKVPKLLIDLARLFLIVIGIAFVVSSIWGVDLTKLLTALGVGSVVLGLALQDTLSGVFAGFALLSGNQFNIGDWLKVDDVEGQIEGMDWRSVTLRTRENDYMVIPNTMLAKNRFRNFTKPTSQHMERVPFDISFDDAPHHVKDILISVAKQTSGILAKPAPAVALLSYDEFSVKYEVQYHIKDYGSQPAIRNDFISAVWYAASRDGFIFPTRSHELYHFEGQSTQEKDFIPQIIAKLKQFSFELAEDEYQEVAQYIKLYHFGVGEEILKQDEITKFFYLITKGSVEQSFEGQNDKKYKIGKMYKGEFFGMRTMTGSHPNETSVYAIEATEVLILDRNAMKLIMKNHPAFAHSIENVVQARDSKLSKIKQVSNKKA